MSAYTDEQMVDFFVRSSASFGEQVREVDGDEWVAPTPTPHGNFGPQLPTVYRGPYEYSSPEVEEDYLPQNRLLPGSRPAPAH